jgi:N-acetylmuramoyl-L-alanine amidase
MLSSGRGHSNRGAGPSAIRWLGACVLCLYAAAVPFAQSNVEELYREAVRREGMLRKEIDDRKADSSYEALLERSRTLTQTFEDIARLFPRSGYSDNAVWQGAVLAADAFWEFGEVTDRDRARRLFEALEARYPTSPLLKQVPAHTARLTAAGAAPAAAVVPPRPPPLRPLAAPSSLKAIRREVLPDALRVTLELEHEVPFYDERIEGPPRVLVDLHNTRAVEALKDAALNFPDDVVRHIRVGRQQDARTRVVLDIQGAARHSVYALYNPYRIVVDFERLAPTRDAAATAGGRRTIPSAEAAAPTGRGLSLSRQLGLGVARVVIDPGHGGHDPGAEVRGLNEAEVTLDVALRLEKLLLKQPGVEVVLTRRTNTYVPLEERTAIANRAAADLFLSIHANGSADARARGVETYFLNFASNSAAEALAARENAGSSRTMRELPDIVKAITLNDKIDESRDFASFVQATMFEKLRRVNKQARNLGIKQAPFVVLIGATMPSILAEISFLTNRQEAALLRTAKYRDQIADALLTGVMKYQGSLKASREVAAR